MPPVLSSVLSHYVDTLVFNRISRLNTWPARTPVNASAAALLPPPHDSGPVWLATPSPYGSLIHDTLPVFPALSGHPMLETLTLFRVLDLIYRNKQGCHTISRGPPFSDTYIAVGDPVKCALHQYEGGGGLNNIAQCHCARYIFRHAEKERQNG